MITTLVTAGFGAIWGAILRYGITNYGKKHWSSNFPYATLLLNLTGAFLFGLVFSRNFSPFVYALVGTGVLGGYTTFSTLNVELLSHWQDHNYKTFLLYALLSYGGGLILVFAGYKAGLII